MQALLDNQTNAISKLQKCKVRALFMEPGTGKTRSAIELIKSVPDATYVLWLTPFRTKDNLQAEIDKWGGLDHVQIVGIETISSSDKTYLQIFRKLEVSWCSFIIVDESLKIKNYNAIRTKRILEFGKMAEYKLILNGTPISRNLLDAWAQFDFLSPKILNMGMAEYKNTFCEYTKITKYFGKSRKPMVKEFITKYHNIDYLYSLIQPYVFECDLSIDIGKQYIDIDFKIEEEIMKEYQMLKEKYLDNEKLQFLNNNIFL